MSSFRSDTSSFSATAVRPMFTYSTTFAGITQNPLSEGGRWTPGSLTGVFQNMQCTPGFCYGAGPSASPPYDDPTTVLSCSPGSLWQSVEATVQITAIEGGANQEVELRLLTTIRQGNGIVGYEVLFSITTNNYIQIMQWDGGTDITSFHEVNFRGSGTGLAQLATGNRVKATVDRTGLITAYIDYGSGFASVLSGTDTTWRTGSPGTGAFKHAGAAGPLTGAGITTWACEAF